MKHYLINHSNGIERAAERINNIVSIAAVTMLIMSATATIYGVMDNLNYLNF
jgi:hypothetical protein